MAHAHATFHDLLTFLTPEHHWHQGAFNDNDLNPTCFCLAGAIAYVEQIPAQYSRLDNHPVVKQLALAIDPDFRPDYFETHLDIVTAWNDAPNRTHKDVLSLLQGLSDVPATQLAKN